MHQVSLMPTGWAQDRVRADDHAFAIFIKIVMEKIDKVRASRLQENLFISSESIIFLLLILLSDPEVPTVAIDARENAGLSD